jgi:hypothetical protein
MWSRLVGAIVAGILIEDSDGIELGSSLDVISAVKRNGDDVDYCV